MKLYHASTIEIESFYIPDGGLHFGGLHSAITAALRHYYRNDLKTNYIHIHCCDVDVSSNMLVDDQGGADDWELYHLHCIRNNSVLKYINKYEPDNEHSYCLFHANKVLDIEHSTMHIDTAEDMLVQFESYEKKWELAFNF